MILNLLDTRNLLDPWREGDSCAYRGKLAPGHIFPSTLPKPTTGALRILRWAAWATDDPDLVQQPSGFCWLRHLLKYCCKPHIVKNSRAMEASRLFESHNLWEQPVWCRSSAHLLQYWNLKQPQPLHLFVGPLSAVSCTLSIWCRLLFLLHTEYLRGGFTTWIMLNCLDSLATIFAHLMLEGDLQYSSQMHSSVGYITPPKRHVQLPDRFNRNAKIKTPHT